MLNAVTKAILTAYNNSPRLKELLTGGLWYSQAPEMTTGDYVVFDYSSTVFDEMMGAADNSEKTSSVIMNVFVQDKSGSMALNNITEKIREVYNWQNLQMLGKTFISSQVTSIDTVITDQEYWQVMMNLEIRYI